MDVGLGMKVVSLVVLTSTSVAIRESVLKTLCASILQETILVSVKLVFKAICAQILMSALCQVVVIQMLHARIVKGVSCAPVKEATTATEKLVRKATVMKDLVY